VVVFELRPQPHDLVLFEDGERTNRRKSIGCEFTRAQA
jgi:hypothetical protein